MLESRIVNDVSLVPIRWSVLEDENLLGKFGALVYRALLRKRGADNIVAAPITDVASWLQLKPAKLYPPIALLESAGLCRRVRCPRSRTGRGVEVFGNDTPFRIVDGPNDASAVVCIPDHAARWALSGGDNRLLVWW